jgi:PAS domain S-box-containing protein
MNDINNHHRFINSLRDGVVIIDPQGVTQFINHAALQMLSVNPNDFVGVKLDEKLIIQSEHGQSVSVQELLIGPVLSEMTSRTIDRTGGTGYFFVRSDRSQFPVSMTAFPFQASSFEPGVTMVFHDITAEEKIEQSKSEFVSLISHQLRTPVNIVSWYAEKLYNEKKGDLNPKQQEYLREIMASNKRIIDLVSAIVNVSRTDLDSLKNKREDVELASLVKDTLRQLLLSAEEKNISIEQAYEIEPAFITESDKEYMGVALHNVIKNAIKYTGDGGHIIIRLRQVHDGESVLINGVATSLNDGFLISIQDNGLGIPDEQKEDVFVKLFRADNVKALDVTGLGLGLYIARSFINTLGGKVWFDSKVRQGTTFYIFAPKQLPL